MRGTGMAIDKKISIDVGLDPIKVMGLKEFVPCLM